jgi:hypothetical protein
MVECLRCGRGRFRAGIVQHYPGSDKRQPRSEAPPGPLPQKTPTNVDCTASLAQPDRMLRLLPTAGLLALLVAVRAPTQERLPLPNGTGSLQKLPGWTTAAVPDATVEPARTMLAAVQDKLRSSQSPDDHTLAHAVGSKSGELRLVHCFSTPGPLTREALLAPAFAEQLRAEVERNLAGPGTTVRFVGGRQPTLFGINSLAVAFEVERGGHALHVEHHLVPAGQRVQNFEAAWCATDVDGRGEIEALLRTFDGAREGREDRTLQTMLLGGLCGGILGVVTARWRQRRRAATAADTAN